MVDASSVTTTSVMAGGNIAVGSSGETPVTDARSPIAIGIAITNPATLPMIASPFTPRPNSLSGSNLTNYHSV
jgi:hypothetical protein